MSGFRADSLTVKAQETIQQAQRIARENDHQNLSNEHLLLALIDDRDGLPTRLLEKAGIDRGSLQQDLHEALKRRPRVTGSGEIYLDPELRKALDLADAERERMKDDFVSTEHLFLAILKEGGKPHAPASAQG